MSETSSMFKPPEELHTCSRTLRPASGRACPNAWLCVCVRVHMLWHGPGLIHDTSRDLISCQLRRLAPRSPPTRPVTDFSPTSKTSGKKHVLLHYCHNILDTDWRCAEASDSPTNNVQFPKNHSNFTSNFLRSGHQTRTKRKWSTRRCSCLHRTPLPLNYQFPISNGSTEKPMQQLQRVATAWLYC